MIFLVHAARFPYHAIMRAVAHYTDIAAGCMPTARARSKLLAELPHRSRL